MLSEDYTEQTGIDALKAIDDAHRQCLISPIGMVQLSSGATRWMPNPKSPYCFGNNCDAISSNYFGLKPTRMQLSPPQVAHTLPKPPGGDDSEITELLVAGQIYLVNNAELLETKAKMPAAFPVGYNKAKAAYDANHLQYGAAKGNATDATVDKVTLM